MKASSIWEPGCPWSCLHCVSSNSKGHLVTASVTTEFQFLSTFRVTAVSSTHCTRLRLIFATIFFVRFFFLFHFLYFLSVVPLATLYCSIYNPILQLLYPAVPSCIVLCQLVKLFLCKLTCLFFAKREQKLLTFTYCRSVEILFFLPSKGGIWLSSMIRDSWPYV